jgi:hypothetical protein
MDAVFVHWVPKPAPLPAPVAPKLQEPSKLPKALAARDEFFSILGKDDRLLLKKE